MFKKIKCGALLFLACIAHGVSAQSLFLDGTPASNVEKIFVAKGGYGSNWWDESLGGAYKEFPLKNHITMVSGDCETGTLVYAQITTVGSPVQNEAPYHDYCKNGTFNVPVYAVNGTAERVGSRMVDLLVRKCRYDPSVANGIDCFVQGSNTSTSEVRLQKLLQVSDVILEANGAPGRVQAFGDNKYLPLLMEQGDTLSSAPGRNYLYVIGGVGASMFAILPGSFDAACTAEGKFPPPPMKISFDGQCYDMVIVPSQNIANEWLINYENSSFSANRVTFSFGRLLDGLSGQVKFFAGYAKDFEDLVSNHRWHQVGVYLD